MKLTIQSPPPGVYKGVDAAGYHAWDAANQSFLTDLLAMPPAIALDKLLNPDFDSDAMLLGSAAHCMLLEPELFGDRYGVLPEGTKLSTNVGKEAARKIAESGALAIKQAVWDTINGWSISIEHLPLAAKALDAARNAGNVELSLVWDDDETGVRCKARLDAWINGWIVDLKTTAATDEHALQLSCIKYGLDVQAAFYVDGAEKMLPNPEGTEFAHLYLMKERTWPVRLMDMGEWLDRGRILYRKALRIYAECKRTNEWPGYEREGLVSLKMPAWANYEKE